MDEKQEKWYRREFDLAKLCLDKIYGVNDLKNIEGFYLAGKIRDFVFAYDDMKKWDRDNVFQFADEAIQRFWFELYDYVFTDKDLCWRVFRDPSLKEKIAEFPYYMRDEAKRFEKKSKGYLSDEISTETKEYLQKIREESYLL